MNPHYLKFTPPTDVTTATLWAYGADSSPASLPFRFIDSSSSRGIASSGHWLSIDLQIGEDLFKRDGLTDSHSCSVIQVPPNIAAAHINGVICSGNQAISVKCNARSIEAFARNYRDGESIGQGLADYIVRMARARHPIDLEFDSGAWGHIDFQIVPHSVQEPAIFDTAQTDCAREVAINRWRMNRFSGLPQHWRRDGSGRGRLIGAPTVES